jgi:hypothetical protein
MVLIFMASIAAPGLFAAKVCAPTANTVEAMYPVGSIYFSTGGTNPATLFGFGTWEQYSKGRVLVGAGSGTDSRGEAKSFSVGGTGGEYNHQLTVAEMPSHSHVLPIGNNNGSAVDKSLGGGGSGMSTNPAGGDGAHNNLQPYIAVYIWRRVS